ncbi:MAG TPA: type II toxin-antitoxin system VapC family toxin [Rubrivivax sp.]|nr:type II toxin-antitoxin system VapC family toxin [Rubrivivax sp.]HPO18171.1 type II toxin-antitoxin system VapC family toxin [Rubrivivax sp.]
MRILPNTHIALWAVTGSRRLTRKARERILAADELHISAATLWEIATKHAWSRGDMPVSSAQALQAFRDAGYALLAVRPQHAVRVEGLPSVHSDPFDRLLVAQAQCEPLTLLTSASLVGQYGSGVMRV